MKTFAVMILSGGSLLLMVIGIDLVSHNSLKDAVVNALNPFRVVDIPEYLIIGSFFLYYSFKELKIVFKNRANRRSN